MNFLKAVLLSLLLHHRAISAEGSFLSEKTSISEDNLLVKLFSTMKPTIEKFATVDLIVVGASDDQLHETKLLLETFTSFVARDVTEICTTRRFARNTVIIYFLSSVDEEYIAKVMRGLVICKKAEMFFIFEGFELSVSDIEFVLRTTRTNTAQQPVFMHHSRQCVKLYVYGLATDCLMKVRLVRDWMPGDDLEEMWDFFAGGIGNGCALTVGAMHRPPWLSLDKDKNGSVRIVDGLEADLISTVSQKLNFTLRTREFELSDRNSIGNQHPTVPSCATGISEICIGHIRPHKKLVDSVDMSHTYGRDCVVWCVPKITHEKSNIMIFEFSWKVWLLTGLTFLVNFAVDIIVRSSHPLNRGNTDRSGYCVIILDLIGSTLGNPTIYNPLSLGGKLLLISYLLYSTVITTAYKTSLSSILTVDNRVSSIENVEGIIRANLTIGGDELVLAILEDQRGENTIIPELMRRFTIEPNITKALLRVSNDKDFAYLTSLTELTHHKRLLAGAGEFVSVQILSECVLTRGAVMVVPKSSYLNREIDQIIRHLVESGLLKYWMERIAQRTHRSNLMNTDKQLYGFTRDKFYHILKIYCLALILSTLIFLGELTVHKFKFGEKVQRFKNLIRNKVSRVIPL